MNVIHIALIFLRGKKYLFLHKIEPRKFAWFEDQNETVAADNIEDAIRLAVQHWKKDAIKMLNCGFRYTLPERDEHGLNALFWQMVASYNSPTGVYFDEELGCNCIVQNASTEARNLWNQMKENETAKRP